MLLVIFVASIVFLMFLIIKVKLNPFIALLSTAIIIGFASGMPILKIPEVIASGFGGTMEGIGIVIALGIILGQILYETGATEQIANLLLRKVGDKNSPLAMNATGYIVSIPVFFDAAFVILINIAKQLSLKTKISVGQYATALAVGLIVTHSVVIPTPGPLAVVGNMNANIAYFLFYSIIITIPATLVGGVLYGKFIAARSDFPAATEADFVKEETAKLSDVSREKPSGSLAIFLIILPIFLILLGTVMNILLAGTEYKEFNKIFAFLGNKNIALFIGVLVAFVTLNKYLPRPLDDILTEAAQATGIVFLITGAGGSFGKIINATGIGDYLVATMTHINIPILLLAFLLSQILRIAQGSTTVALVTTSSIMAPIVAQMGLSPVLVGLAICCGGIGGSLPNDSGFWVVNRFSNLTLNQTFKVWTMGGTVAGVTGFLMVVLLSMFSNVLPGL